MEEHPQDAGPSAPRDHAGYRFGIFQFDPIRGQLRRDSRPVRLRPQAAALLTRLLADHGEPVSRDDLRVAVWGRDTYVEHEVGLNTLIRAVRRALRDDADNPRFIRTIPRVGYTFIAPMERLDAGEFGTTAAATEGGERRRAWPPIAATVVLVAATVIAALAMWSRDPSPGRRLAVLPLEHTGGGEDERYLALAVTEGLIRELSRVAPDRLEVVAHPASGGAVAEAYLGDVGEQLGLDLVLVGAIVPTDGGPHVSVQVLRQGSRAVVWSFGRDLGAVDADGVARQVATQLAAALDIPREVPAALAPTPGPLARDAYLKSLCFEARPGLESWHEAISWLDRAIELEPTYADAYSRRAQLLVSHPTGAMHRTLARRADADATRALNLDPGAASPLAVRAKVARCLGQGDAVQRATAAVARSPANAGPRLVLAMALQVSGRPREAQREVDRALELDPLRILSADGVGWIHLTAGRTNMAVEHLLRVEALHPQRRFSLGFYLALIEALEGAGRIDEAADACRRCAGRHGIAIDDAAWAQASPTNRVSSFWEWMAAWSSFQFERFPDTTIGPQFTIRPLLRLGRYDDAIEAITRAEGVGYCSTLLGFDPIYAPIRDDERIRALIEARPELD